MTFPVPYGGITIAVERPTFDRFNDATYAQHHLVPNCIEYPATSAEGSPNVGLTDARSLIAPPGADIQATDRVVLPDATGAIPTTDTPEGAALRRALTYQVVGRPKDWVHAMTGWHPGMSVDLEKVT